VSKPVIIDLFCGAGGFSEGFQKAGYRVAGAVDSWKYAAYTYKMNRKVKNVIQKDICDVNKSNFARNPDVVVGGPPCQGFSLAGKRDRGDPRNKLFRHFVRLVSDLEPKIVLMENVRGILSMNTEDEEPVMDVIEREFADIGYRITYKTLNAADYGVPQIRERVFIVANSIGEPNGRLFPKETYGLKSRQKKEYRTVREAIADIRNVPDPNDAWNHKPMNHVQRVVDRFSLIPQGMDIAKNQTFLPRKLRRRGFASNCRRLDYNQPSVTIVPGHYAFPVHPTLPRTLTVREIARLQTFDDADIFYAPRVQQGILVGNGVPPLLAKAFAHRFKKFV